MQNGKDVPYYMVLRLPGDFVEGEVALRGKMAYFNVYISEDFYTTATRTVQFVMIMSGC